MQRRGLTHKASSFPPSRNASVRAYSSSCGPRLRDDVPALRIQQAWTSPSPRISIVCTNSSPSHAYFNRRAINSTRGSWRLENEV